MSDVAIEMLMDALILGVLTNAVADVFVNVNVNVFAVEMADSDLDLAEDFCF